MRLDPPTLSKQLITKKHRNIKNASNGNQEKQNKTANNKKNTPHRQCLASFLLCSSIFIIIICSKLVTRTLNNATAIRKKGHSGEYVCARPRWHIMLAWSRSRLVHHVTSKRLWSSLCVRVQLMLHGAFYFGALLWSVLPFWSI